MRGAPPTPNAGLAAECLSSILRCPRRQCARDIGLGTARLDVEHCPVVPESRKQAISICASCHLLVVADTGADEGVVVGPYPNSVGHWTVLTWKLLDS